MDLKFLVQKRINIVGLGKTGFAAAAFFKARNFELRVWDDNEAAREKAIADGFIVDDLSDLDSAHDVIIWSPGIPHYGPKAHKIALNAMGKNIRLISDIDILCAALPHQDMIAITGTNGKSTTTALIHHTLAQFKPCVMGGNIGAPVLSLNEQPKDSVYVLECSSYQLELTPHLQPLAAILLNITPDHIDRHGDMNGYVNAKENIFAHARCDAAQSIAIIGQDTDICREITARVHAKNKGKNKWIVIPISVQSEQSDGVWVNQAGDMLDRGTKIANFNEHEILKGDHNFENMLACYATLKYAYGFEAAAIWRAMLSFKGLPHRQFLCRAIGNTKFINDSKATNADAAEKALKSYKNIYWIAGGQAKEGGLNGLQIFKDHIKHTALIGDAASEFSKFLTAHNMPHTESKTLEQAVADLWALAQNDPEESVILLSPACASWDQFKSFEHRGDMFETYVATLSEPQTQKALA